MTVDIKDLVKNNIVTFSRYNKGILYYTIIHFFDETAATYEFPIPIKDCAEATFFAEEKAKKFLYFIGKAVKNGEFVKV